MEDCIFCKIINGEIPSSKIYEDNDTIVFLDIAPINKGHCLVVPKKHYLDLLDAPSDLVTKVMRVSQKVGEAVMKGVKADGFNIGINNKKAAGQVVFHLHVHVIPRFKNDGLQLWKGGKYKENEVEYIKKNIALHL